jgi:peptidoglycan/LPS O-acetylase OafA/YrhL
MITQSGRDQNIKYNGRYNKNKSIQGLRAVAVLLVVFFHLDISVFSAGYIGVDMFFVISGYLISKGLVNELQNTSRISFRKFYFRRIKRLLPMASITAGLTLLLTKLYISPLRFESIFTDGLSAIFSFANYRFSLTQVDYSNAGTLPSPFLHYWSLSLEEQFYLFWPILILLIFKFTPKIKMYISFSAITILSFALCVYGSYSNPIGNFYSVFSRIWEFSLGAFVFLIGNYSYNISTKYLKIISNISLLSIILFAITAGETIKYPGIWTLIPCLATALIIFCSLPNQYINFGRILDNVVLFGIGEISYSLYLIHWPTTIFTEAILDRPLEFKDKFLIINLMIVAAAAFYFIVEKKFTIKNTAIYKIRNIGRYYLRASIVPVLIGLSLLNPNAFGLVPSVLSTLNLSSRSSVDLINATPANTNTPSPDVTITATPSVTIKPAPATNSSSPSASNTSSPVASPPSTSSTATKPATANPKTAEYEPNFQSPSKVFTLDEVKSVLKSSICISNMNVAEPKPCSYGSKNASNSVVLWGDSHAAQWAGGLDHLGQKKNFKVTDFTKAGCPAARLLTVTNYGKPYPECISYRESALKQILKLKPDLVVVSALRKYSGVFTDLNSGYEYVIKPLTAAGIKVLIISDTPYPKTDIPACISLHLADVARCDSLRKFSTGTYEVSEMLRKISRDNSADFVDPVSWMCDGTNCPAVINNVIVYADGSHMSSNMAVELSSPLAKYILRNL